jgi:hypothetical protein
MNKCNQRPVNSYHDEFGVVIVHRQGAGCDHLARQVAGLSRHVLDSLPMHGEQYRVRLLRSLSRRSGLDLALGAAGELLELRLAAGVAEYHLKSVYEKGVGR